MASAKLEAAKEGGLAALPSSALFNPFMLGALACFFSPTKDLELRFRRAGQQAGFPVFFFTTHMSVFVEHCPQYFTFVFVIDNGGQ